MNGLFPRSALGESELIFLVAEERSFTAVHHLQVALLHQRRQIDAEIHLFLCHNLNNFLGVNKVMAALPVGAGLLWYHSCYPTFYGAKVQQFFEKSKFLN